MMSLCFSRDDEEDDFGINPDSNVHSESDIHYNSTPCESPYNTDANVPPVRSGVSNFVTICSINLFLEVPINIGHPKL